MVTLQRLGEFRGATIGLLKADDLILWALELPWKGNQPQLSCAPLGTYVCKPHGWNGEPVRETKVWELQSVTDREAILIHAGNTTADSRGCILVGLGVNIGVNAAVTSSREAIELLRKKFNNIGFVLEISGACQAEN